MGCFVLLLAMVMTQVLPGSAHTSWKSVLIGFDLIRAEAYEQDRPDLFDRVYARGSGLLEEDRGLLASYSERRILLDDMRMDVVSVRLVERDARRVRLDVVDRLELTRLRLPDGSMRDLPRDHPSRHTIELSLTVTGWRISSVRP